MKKYLLGIFAVVLAVCFTAFSLPQSTYTYKMTLTGDSDPTDQDYDDVANWALQSSPSCTGAQIPCKVQVLQSTIDPYIDFGENEVKGLVDYLIAYRTANSASAMESLVESTLTVTKKNP